MCIFTEIQIKYFNLKFKRKKNAKSNKNRTKYNHNTLTGNWMQRKCICKNRIKKSLFKKDYVNY